MRNFLGINFVLPVLSLFSILLIPPTVLAQGAALPTGTATPPGSSTFTNPLLNSGADPWVIAWKGNFYFTCTTGRNLTLWKTSDITDLRNAEKKVVWTPKPGKAWSHGVWAPELHRWGKKWYLYFAADAGDNSSHRLYVLENRSDDPTQGKWKFKGKIADHGDHWAIDADLFELNGKHYLLWSGWRGDHNGEQDIYIARMRKPWKLGSPRALISSPTYPWEKIDGRPNQHIEVNEGPEALIHGDKIFVFYSASGCWTDNYALGAVVASTGSDLLEPASWKKFDQPFLQQDPQAGVYGPGHNGFFKSLDGKQDWIIYHANPGPHMGCKGRRSPRIQQFTWNADGTPNFGRPVGADQALAKPDAGDSHE